MNKAYKCNLEQSQRLLCGGVGAGEGTGKK